MRYLYRCTHSDCKKRHSLSRRLEQYRRRKRCVDCGRCLTGKRDLEPRRRSKANTCTCDGYPFPHRRGSLWCNGYEKQRTEKQIEARYAA
jgi:hypothetical protein